MPLFQDLFQDLDKRRFDISSASNLHRSNLVDLASHSTKPLPASPQQRPEETGSATSSINQSQSTRKLDSMYSKSERSRGLATLQRGELAGSSRPGHSLNPAPKPSRSIPTHQKVSLGSRPSHTTKNVLIAVFGMTGTGKTTLIKKLAGDAAMQLKTGHGLESCTQAIETVECKIEGCNVTLVDTPGFDDSMRSDTEILTLIAEWLQSSYQKDTFLSGIIYLHRISDIRMSGSSIKNLRMFRKLCGTENMSKVSLVTTMWDKVSPEEGALREQQLDGPGGFWSAMVSNGSLVKRHDGSAKSAQALVLDMLDNRPMMIRLQEEIASGKALIDTDAGASINEEILKLQEQHGEELEAVREEMTMAMKQGNRALQEQLQAEHARMVAQMEAKAQEQYQLQQMRVNKLESDLQDASLARKRFEAALESQKEASRCQEERASRLERDFQSMSTERKRLETLVETQNKTLLAAQNGNIAKTQYFGSKRVICSSAKTPGKGCGQHFKIYGQGACKCPFCGQVYRTDEAFWNSVAWC